MTDNFYGNKYVHEQSRVFHFIFLKKAWQPRYTTFTVSNTFGFFISTLLNFNKLKVC